jgi:hypothetical protein
VQAHDLAQQPAQHREVGLGEGQDDPHSHD